MNGAARWRKITNHPLFSPLLNVLSDPPHNPSPNSSPNTSPNASPNLLQSQDALPNPSPDSLPGPPLTRVERLRDIFPPGLEGSMASIKRPPHTFAPHYLHDILSSQDGGNRHVERTIVKSAWYGKQKKSAMHEFILIQVEHLAIPGGPGSRTL